MLVGVDIGGRVAGRPFVFYETIGSGWGKPPEEVSPDLAGRAREGGT